MQERDIVFAGNGDNVSSDGTGNDLALLAQCNHTIQSYGTYSYMAGALAGGINVIPYHFKEYRTKKEHKTKKILQLDPLEHPLPRLYMLERLE